MTRVGTASSDVEGYVVRFGGSVGDFTGADIEEDDNNIPVILGPIRAEVSFYDDGSDNSIFVDTEDTVNVTHQVTMLYLQAGLKQQATILLEILQCV